MGPCGVRTYDSNFPTWGCFCQSLRRRRGSDSSCFEWHSATGTGSKRKDANLLKTEGRRRARSRLQAVASTHRARAGSPPPGTKIGPFRGPKMGPCGVRTYDANFPTWGCFCQSLSAHWAVRPLELRPHHLRRKSGSGGLLDSKDCERSRPPPLSGIYLSPLIRYHAP
jgi:hypothetical protein